MLNLAKLWSNVVGPATRPVAPPLEIVPTIPRELKAPARRVESIQLPAKAEPSQTREAKRFVPRRTATVLTTSAGKKIHARIINLSQLGVAIEADFSQAGPDTVVMVGSRPVSQGRRITLGTVFLFMKPIDPAVCDPDIIV